jgi:hypothetical protein
MKEREIEMKMISQVQHQSQGKAPTIQKPVAFEASCCVFELTSKSQGNSLEKQPKADTFVKFGASCCV